MYTIHEQPELIYGLKYRPSLEPERDDNTDFYGEFHRHVPREFSPANQDVLRQALWSAPRPRCIVEIGVQRNPLPESSTGILLRHKPADCAFIGIDIEDKSHLADAGARVYTLQMDSADRAGALPSYEGGPGGPGVDRPSMVSRNPGELVSPVNEVQESLARRGVPAPPAPAGQAGRGRFLGHDTRQCRTAAAARRAA